MQMIIFGLRQVYRLLVVWPFQLGLTVSQWFDNKNILLTDSEPNSFCFIVTSVVYPKETKQIQYNCPRTLFTPEERAQQTLKTIASIYTKVPEAKIILVEGGVRGILPLDIAQKVDQYVYVGEKKLVRWACDSKYKSLGETMMLLTAIKQFQCTADFYFKISGRYYLNEEFSIADWKQGSFVLKYIQEDYVCTRLYGWRAGVFTTWKYALMKGAPLVVITYAIENTLAKYIPRRLVHRLTTLGLSGLGGSDNTVIKD